MLALLAPAELVRGQTVPVGLLEDTDDILRRQQLLGLDSSGSSMMIRPLFMPRLIPEGRFDADVQNWNRLIYSSSKKSITLSVLPIVFQQQINTHHPYGINDGAMIPAKGYQASVSAGLYAKIGPLSIQLRPEYIYAANERFREITELNHGESFTKVYTRYRNRIDEPERFGTGSYSKLNFGQSGIRLNAGPVSFGLSNENLWWGPGIRSSLLMSNNAAGFKHLTLNTLRPVATFIGTFEAQLIAGRLDGSGIPQPAGPGYVAKTNDWRYISGGIITYQPKWISGLYLGIDRTYVINSRNLGKGFFDYFPVFSAFAKNSYNKNGVDEENAKLRDQRISFFCRWILKESKAEFYFQYGKNDHNYNLRDAIVEPEHSRAYVAGMRKLVALARPNEFIQLGLEVTQLESPSNKLIREGDYWYGSGPVNQGYTQLGQVIGAGIGSAGNMQSMDVSWVKGVKRIGLQLERVVHNADIYYRAFSLVDNNIEQWVDYGITGKFDYDYKAFILNSQLSYIGSRNYQWESADPSMVSNNDVKNVHFKIGIAYRL